MQTTKPTESGLGKKAIVVLLFAIAAALLPATAQAQTSYERRKINELGFVIALGAEFDHRLNRSTRLGMLAGLVVLASPLHVKLNERSVNVIREYAYIFLTRHVRARFHPQYPMLHLWAERGPLDTFYAKDGGLLGIWGQWAQVKGQAMKGGHFFAEKNPDDTAFLLERFLSA